MSYFSKTDWYGHRLFVFQWLVRVFIKETSNFRITDRLWRESTGDRWIPHTNDQQCGRYFMPWRHQASLLWEPLYDCSNANDIPWRIYAYNRTSLQKNDDHVCMFLWCPDVSVRSHDISIDRKMISLAVIIVYGQNMDTAVRSRDRAHINKKYISWCN